MKLPRRVPWASLSELEQICSWIYTDENDLDSKVLAINRLSAWKATVPLPHALESTLSLLVAILQDSSLQSPNSHLSLRQSYSTAIIRLVNGLVDPLQLGAYARSIASIASQLGLPLWLVELRHAATHEDLPSIDLLREAARESMVWLLHNYFLPTINPASAPASQTPLRPLAPILKQYKSLLKITTRDTSLKSQYKPAVLSTLKDVERWIAEAKVAANVTAGEIGWEIGASEMVSDSGDMDIRERWALEKLCDALLEKGALVPLSKKKRQFPTEVFYPPNFSVLLWTPLLRHLQTLHPGFLIVLGGRIASILLADKDTMKNSAEIQQDLSYDMCLARWALWSIETWEGDNLDADLDLRKEITANLMQSLGHIIDNSLMGRKAAIALLESMCSGTLQLELALTTLQKLADKAPTSTWVPNDISVMDQRLNTLLSLGKDSPDSRPQMSPEDLPTSPVEIEEPIPGWRLLHEGSGWRPCPIGVHHARV